MIETYSIVIHPQDHIIRLFRDWKNQLKIKAGKYGSCNSVAHITILEFDATENELKYIKEKLVRIVQKEISFDAVFNKIISSDSSKSIFVLPDEDGKDNFKKLLQNIRKKIKGHKNKSAAHLTIGRKLKPEQLEKSKGLFSAVEFNFNCSRIALRRLNKNIGQFEILEIFPFSGIPNKTEQLNFGF